MSLENCLRDLQGPSFKDEKDFEDYVSRREQTVYMAKQRLDKQNYDFFEYQNSEVNYEK